MIVISDLTCSVAERCGGLVADPAPHGHGALQLGAGNEAAFVELLGVEADRVDVVAAAGGLVALHEIGYRRAAVAGDADSDAVEREADGFLGEKHERRPPALGGTDGDKE